MEELPLVGGQTSQQEKLVSLKKRCRKIVSHSYSRKCTFVRLPNSHVTDQNMSDNKQYLIQSHADIFLYVHTKEFINWTQ